MNEGEVVLELDFWNVRERVWDPGRGSSRQAGRITSTKTSSERRHDRWVGGRRAFSVPRYRTRITLPSMLVYPSMPPH